MKTRTSTALRVMRITLTTVCSLSLVLPTTAHARASEPAQVSPDEATDDLPPKARKHVVKGIQQFEGNAYSNAEEEFRRAAFFAPKWRSLHFNLGVVAEAQGKLGTALSEYQAFKPYASPDETMVVDQRIYELNNRRKRIAAGYKRQIAASAIAMTLGVGMLGGGAALIVIRSQDKKSTAPDPDIQQKYPTYGGVLLVFGLMAVVYSFLPLTKSIKSKRQLDGLALGPTRLHWDGGAGARLRF